MFRLGSTCCFTCQCWEVIIRLSCDLVYKIGITLFVSLRLDLILELSHKVSLHSKCILKFYLIKRYHGCHASVFRTSQIIHGSSWNLSSWVLKSWNLRGDYEDHYSILPISKVMHGSSFTLPNPGFFDTSPLGEVY